jgi:hypothetical protein
MRARSFEDIVRRMIDIYGFNVGYEGYMSK